MKLNNLPNITKMLSGRDWKPGVPDAMADIFSPYHGTSYALKNSCLAFEIQLQHYLQMEQPFSYSPPR